MRCAIYARYSSEEQSQASIDDQVREIRAYILSQGWIEARDQMYVDEAKSATSTSGRTQFLRMMGMAQSRERPFDAILIWHSSRFARNRMDAVTAKAVLAKAGVRVVSVTQPFDSDTAEGKLVEGIFESLDEYWSRKIAVDVRRAMDGISGRGYRAGGVAPFGYELERIDDPSGLRRGKEVAKRTRLVVSDRGARIVVRIFRDFAAGQSYSAIARGLNRARIPSPWAGTSRKPVDRGWDPSSVRAILFNSETYAGHTVYGRRKRIGRNPTRMVNVPRDKCIIVEHTHPPVVPPKLLAAVEERKAYVAAKFAAAGNPKAARSVTPSHLLSGVVKCGECGASVVLISGSAKRRSSAYYGCSYHNRRGTCDNAAAVPMDDAERAVIDLLREVILQPEYLAVIIGAFRARYQEAAQEAQGQQREFQSRRRSLQRQLDNFLTIIGRGEAPQSVLGKIEDLEQEIARLDEAERARKPARAPKMPSESVIREKLVRVRDQMGRASVAKLRRTIEFEMESLTYHRDRSITAVPSAQGVVGHLLGLEPVLLDYNGVPNGI